MKIDEIIKNKRTLSFEVFPPKKDDEYETKKIFDVIDRLKKLNPDYISVTYGASGSNSKNTALIADYIKNTAKIEALAHITGGPSSPTDIDELVKEFKSKNIENILALRGDKPIDSNIEYCKYFKHATDLMDYLKNDDFCIAGACYPEGHVESDTLFDDLINMKKKEEAGAKFFVTQVFYDNNYYYRLVNEARKIGIKSPIIPGIMPITSSKNIKKIKSMCGTAIPLEFRHMIEKYVDNNIVMREIGINFSVYQIMDLISNGAPGIHLYVMNNAKLAEDIYNRLADVFKELF